MNIINEIAMEIYQAQLPTIGPDKATRWKSGPNPTSPARGSGRCKSRPRARGGILPCLGKSVVAPSSALSGGPIEWWHYGFNELICVDLGAEKLGVSSFRSWHVLACLFPMKSNENYSRDPLRAAHDAVAVCTLVIALCVIFRVPMCLTWGRRLFSSAMPSDNPMWPPMGD